MSNQPTLTQNRSANASIAGFVYQFDLTALEILNAKSNTTITVEGCEDIDLHGGPRNTAVQCKYLPASKYSLAGLRKPIIPMLESFANGNEWDYRLYVHYGDSTTPPTKLTVDELKSCLTESKRKPPRTINHCKHLSHKVLERFLRRFSIQAGDAFETQQAAVHAALQTALGATADDVRDLHYPKALSIILDTAMQPQQSQRELTRPGFLTLLDKRPEIYTRWHTEIVGAERMRASLKRRIKAVGLLAGDKRRLIVLAPPSTGRAGDLVKISHLVEKLATTAYGEGKLSSAKPWTVICDAPDEEVLELKRKLVSLGIAYHDGYETVRFSAEMFNRAPTINTYSASKKIKCTSYDVRLISAATYRANRAQIDPPAVAISFAASRAKDFVDDESVQTLDVPGWGAEHILDLLGVAK